jgi:hypothetical protein
MGKDMRGQRPSGEDYEKLGERSIIAGEGLYFLLRIFSGSKVG